MGVVGYNDLDRTPKSLYALVSEFPILCWIENFKLGLSKLNNPFSHFWILGAHNDLMILDAPWTSRSNRLVITLNCHEAFMVRPVGDVVGL